MKTMTIETISDQMLRDLLTTEQISAERYQEEMARRAAERVTEENTASRLDDMRHWRCFHCDEVFTTEDSARLHFGETECQSPACQIKAGAELSMLEALRRAEEEARKAVIAMHEEGTDGWTAFRRLEGRTRQNAEAAENLGYERGLRDGRETSARFVEQRLDDYVSEHGVTDPDTGTVEYPGNGEEYVYEIEEIVEGIRSLASPIVAFGSDLPEVDGLRWLRPGGLMPRVINAETAAGTYHISPDGDGRWSVSGLIAGSFGTVEEAVAAVARHHVANVSSGGDHG